MKTLEELTKLYNDYAQKREQISAEMLRLEGEARLVQEMNKKVEEPVKAVKKK
jgi:hypothetical protein